MYQNDDANAMRVGGTCKCERAVWRTVRRDDCHFAADAKVRECLHQSDTGVKKRLLVESNYGKHVKKKVMPCYNYCQMMGGGGSSKYCGLCVKVSIRFPETIVPSQPKLH